MPSKLIKFKKLGDNRIDLRANAGPKGERFDVVVNDGIADAYASRYNFTDLTEAEQYFKTFRGREFKCRRSQKR